MLKHAVAWCSCAFAGGGLLVEIANLFDFPLLQPAHAASDSIVACVAMRNEAANAAACLESLLCQPEIAAVVVCDDGSEDGTREILSTIASRSPRVVPLNLGVHDDPVSVARESRGKAAALALAACRAAAFEATMLLFTDADVRLGQGAAGALARHAEALGVDAVSAWPRTVARSLWDAVFAPLVPLFLLQCLPLTVARHSPDPRFAAANGQLFLVRREAYERSGGHARGAIVEDVALARALKRSGARIALASAAAVASVDGYGSFGADVGGYGRSLYYGTGRKGALVFGLWQALAFVAPWILLRGTRRPALLAAAANVAAHALIARRMRARVHLSLAPLTGIAGVMLAAWVTVMGPRGRLMWRGRALP